MPVFNQSRSRVIQFIFAGVFIAITGQLINLQLFSSKYKLAADNNAFYRKVIYPDRGIIFDRKKRGILENTISYDLVVIPSEARGTDTATLCRLLNIDTATYKKRMRDLIFKNTSVKPSVFEALLTQEMFAKLNENMYRFPGFSLNERSVRNYPYNVGAAILGYMAEVDTGFLRRHKDEGYEMGDYFGSTGLENTYEKVLMGQRGIKRFIRDNKGRLQGSWENGAYDTAAIAGQNLYSSIDVELQQLGEKLMENKVGSIVAIDPKTGGILCMVSAPTYNPNYLTGNQRKKHLVEMLYFDPRLPLLNRTLSTAYAPGSTFKTFVGIVGMAEGAIDDQMTVSCGGAYHGCGRPMGCHAKGTFTLKPAISKSCNSYFAVTFRRILDHKKYADRNQALSVFNDYAHSFGLGSRLGVDLPSERNGFIPEPEVYHRKFGKNWQSCNIISNSIGQGEILTNLTQVANVMAIIANKGWYYTPHLIDSIEGGDDLGLLDKYRVKHKTKEIADFIWEEVHEGMQGTMEFGTGYYAKVPGINVCGKTGTVENQYRGEKLKDHAFFGAFAPRENPRIAIAVMCENAGYGATSAAPIASLLIEKYLKDSITGNDRKAKVEQLANMNLIPPQMKRQMVQRDSLRQARQLAAAKKAARDTSGVEEAPEETETDSSGTNNKPQPAKKGTKKDTANKVALLPEEKRKINIKRKTTA